MLALADGRTAVAADPDRDQIYVVDIVARQLVATIALIRGDEPGRVVEDSHGQVHVSLRGGGALLTLDPIRGTITQRRAICPAPRGLAYDVKTDQVHVACAGGELVTVLAGGGESVRTRMIDSDLRDVVVDGDQLHLTRFRSSEIITVSREGLTTGRVGLGDFRSPAVRGGQLFTPSVAWRMVSVPGGGSAVVHQRGAVDEVQRGMSASYGGTDPCDAIVHSAVTWISSAGVVRRGAALTDFPLAVDIAISPDGQTAAIISAGNSHSAALTPSPSLISRLHVAPIITLSDERSGCVVEPGRFRCAGVASGSLEGGCAEGGTDVTGEAIAVAFLPSGSLIVQSREPAVLNLPGGAIVQLSDESRQDTGHLLFHANAGGGLACASCHAEGADDGRVWNFACAGKLRTQSLQTGIRGTEPLHWRGDEMDFPQLVHDIFTTRMSGPTLRPEQIDAMLTWLDGQPHPPAPSPANGDAVERGDEIFHDAGRAACATCHAGAHLTNGLTMDVGTGGRFQVPSLIGLAHHAPFMHNGCARTLDERFGTACGGGDRHATTSSLSSGELSDLIQYLETL